jgi:hypothetical protein
VTQLLTDVIFFVAEQENTGSEPLEVVAHNPDRERQKLLREQNILKQVEYCMFVSYILLQGLFKDLLYNWGLIKKGTETKI